MTEPVAGDDVGGGDPHDLFDPKNYPPVEELTQGCDLVMKGGLTSGVIYPNVVCELARTRRIHNLGGSSSGAIAAAAAAAAELGRADGGFARLAAMPDYLVGQSGGGRSRLEHLFQAQPATKAVFRFLSVLFNRGTAASKARRGMVAGLRLLLPLPMVVLVEIPLLLLAGSLIQGGSMGIVGNAVLALLGVAVAVIWSLVQRLVQDLPRNGFGLCSGMEGKGHNSEPALTPWLADRYDEIAGRSDPARPLTFGDLADGGIGLAMLTTDLTTSRQNRLPFTDSSWAFSPEEMARLFPPRIVEWMIDHPRRPKTDEECTQMADLRRQGLRPLPDEHDLPVIVGVRLSLSYPVLLSTVPLYSLDVSEYNPRVVKHHFSDGGLTSNLPLHFFDKALPERPTFAIDLQRVEVLDSNEKANVFMGGADTVGPTASPEEITSTLGFALAVKNGMQNWADAMQTEVPGFQDRIVTVKHTRDEGGLNLAMDSAAVNSLTRRGQLAGMEANRFDFVTHRWIRMRSFFHLLEELLSPAADSLRAPPLSDPDLPTYREMIEGPSPGTNRQGWNTGAGYRVADAVEAMADTYAKEEVLHGRSPFERGAPAPRPGFEIRPKP